MHILIINLIEQNTKTIQVQLNLKKQENSWFLELKKLYADGLKQELNKI